MTTESQSQGETHKSVALGFCFFGRKEGLHCRAGNEDGSPRWRPSFHIESTSWTAFANRKCLNETHLDSGLVTMA